MSQKQFKVLFDAYNWRVVCCDWHIVDITQSEFFVFRQGRIEIGKFGALPH